MISIEIEKLDRGSYKIIIDSKINVYVDTEEQANTFVIELLKQTGWVNY